MKIKKRDWVIYSKTGATKILLLGMVVLLLLGCVAVDLLACRPGDNVMQTNLPHRPGGRPAVLVLGLLAASGLIVLLSLGGGARGKEGDYCSEDKYRFLFEESPIANMIIGSDGTIKDVNRSVVNALGYSRDELVGKSALELVISEQRERLTQLQEDIGGEKSRDMDVEVLARDGQVHTFLFSSGRIVSAEESAPADVLVVGIDVTERKKADQALKKERERLFSVLDILPAFVYLQAPDYSVPFVNRRFRELFGDPEGQPCYQAFYGREKPCDPCITLRVLQTRAPQSWEWTSGDGRTYLIHEDLFPGTDGQEMVMEIGIDITERKQAEEELRIGRERYALATQAAKVGVWDWNLKTGEFYLDPNIKATLGYSDQEIPNDLKIWTTYVHPDDREPVMEAAQAHLEGKTPDYVFEHRMRHKDGSHRWIMVRGKAIRDDSGSVVRMVGTDTDITERKEAEQALEEQERNSRTLFDSAPDSITLVSLDGTIVDCNRKAAEIVGMSKSDMLGKHFSRLGILKEEDIPRFAEIPEIVSQISSSGSLEPFEVEVKAGDGSTVWIETYVSLVEKNGEPYALQLISREITERKQVEEERKRHARDLGFLSMTSMGFVELPPDEDIYRFIGEQLKRIVPGVAYIAVNSFDPEEQKITVQCVLGSSSLIEAVWKTIGRDPTGMSFDISQEAREGLTIGKLTKVPGGLHELAFHQLPKVACSALEKLAGIGDIHAMGFTKKEELYGSAVIILRKGKHLDDQDTIEALVRQAGVALQRRQAEEALEMERKKLESVTRNVGVGLALISKDYRTLWANQVLKRMFGEVEGNYCHSAYNHRKEVCPGCGVAQVFENGKDRVVHEQMGKDKHGKTVWSQIITTPIKDAQGNVSSALEVVIPITERKHNEQLQSMLFKIADATNTTGDMDELFRTIRRELGTVLDTTNFFVALYDQKTQTISLPYQVDEKDKSTAFPPGKTLTSWVIRNDRPLLCTQEVRDRLQQSGEIELTETPSQAWLGVPLKVGEETIGAVGVQNYTDPSAYGIKELEILQFASEQIAVTVRRKRVEEALKRSERDYRGLFEGAHDAILVFEPQGETVLDVNQRACDVYGLDRSEFVGMTLEKISKDVPRGKKHIGLTLEKGAYHRFETMQYRKDGSEMFLEVNASVVDYKGQRAILSINRDITDRKRAEEELKSSEQRYRLLFERNLAAVYQTTLDGKVVNCNLSFARLLGYDSPEEILTHNASEFYFNPAERKSFATRLEERSSLTDFEFQLRRKDEQPVWILENVNLIEGTGDLPSLIQGTCIDITQRKQAEEALQSSEDRYRSLFYDSPISLWEEDFSEVKRHLDQLKATGIADFQQHFGDHPQEVIKCASLVEVTNVNKASLNLYRAQSAKQLKTALSRMLAKEEYHPFKDELICIAEGRTSFKRETVTYTLTGEKRHVMMKWSVLPGYEETLSKVVVAMTDITEQRHTQEELEEERERYRNLFETAPDSITTLDAKGFVTSCNAACEKLAGYSRNELIGKHFSKIGAVRIKDLPQYLKLFGAIIRGKLPEPVELEAVHKDGSAYQVEAHISLLKEDDKIKGVQVITRDISERKRAEKALRDSEEKYRSLIQSSNDMIFSVDREGVFETAGGARLKEFGLTPKDVTSKSLYDLFPREEAEFYHRKHLKVFDSGTPETYENTFEFAGVTKTDLTTVYPIKDEKGKVWQVGVVCRDITEAKQAEKALLDSQLMLQTVLDSIPVAVFWKDRNLFYLGGNRTFLDAIGKKATEDIVGKSDYQLPWVREQADAFREDDRRVIESGTPKYNIIEPYLRADGTIAWAKTNKAPLRDARSNIVGVLGTYEDITDRRRAEDLLRTSEAQLSNAMQIAKLGYWEYDVAKDLFTFNDHFYAIFRTSADKVGGYTMKSARYAELFVHPDDRSVVGQEIQKALETTDPHYSRQLEHRIIYADGEIGYVAVRFFVVKDDQGRTIKTYGANQDITERKRGEEALRESEEKYRTLIERQNDVVYRMSLPDGRYEYVSPAAKTVLGYSAEEFLENPFLIKRIIHPEFTKLFEQEWAALLEGKVARTYEYKIIDPEGNERWIIQSNRGIFDNDGSIVAIEGVCRDQTERKKAEEALRKSEEKHRTYVENAPDGIFITDSEARYVDVNQAACRLTGYSKDELLNMRIMDLAPSDEPPEAFDSFEELKRNGKVHSEIAIQRKDGILIYASLDAVVLSDGRYMAFCSDITGRKKAEEALRKAHDLLETRVQERTAELTRANQELRQEISDRQRAEKALVESEERFRSVFENAPLGIGLSAIDGRIIACNDTMLQMTGYTDDELKSIDLKDTYQHAPDREMLFMRLREEKGLVRFEVPRKRKDGSIYVASMTVTRVSLGGESVLLTIAEDITRRKRAEEELRKYHDRLEESVRERTAELRRTNEQLRQEITERKAAENALAAANQRMRMLQEITATVHRSLDPKSVFTQITDTIVSSLGFTTALILTQSDVEDRMKVRSYSTQQKLLEPINQLLGFSIKDFSFPADPKTNASIAKAMKGETVIADTLEEAIYPLLGRRECSMLQKLGGTRYYIIVPLISEGKTVGGIFTTSNKESVPYDEIEILDIFARTAGQAIKNAHLHMKTTQAERALRASEQRYRSIFNQARDGIVLVDAETGKIADCNPEFENQTGRNSGTLKKMKIWEVRPLNKLEAAERKFREIAEIGAGDSSELEFQKPNEETIQVEFAARVVNIGDKKFIQSLVRDITEKRKMEAQLIQAERLAAVGTLAYGIAHEFNNIVAGILGNAEFGMGNDDPKEVEECFRVIMENCDRAKSITNHLLAFARRRQARKEMADVTEAMDNVLGLIERELQKENMRVERKFDPVPEIFCDPGELSEVFLNMITNARDAMRPDGGTLTIGIAHRDGNIEITFTDTGCGIPEGIRQRIFEPFVTTKGALGRSEIPGTGLGLFLAYGIVSSYQGEIKVESREGKGSAFTIRIPISENQMTPGEIRTEKEELATVPQNLRILLVDDEDPICEATRKLLEADGHSVVFTTSGKKGLKLFKGGAFDLVLSDITMPDMDGVKLMSTIKGIDPQVKLIALTGHVKEEELLAARNAGADQILTKPFKKADLYRAMGKAFA